MESLGSGGYYVAIAALFAGGIVLRYVLEGVTGIPVTLILAVLVAVMVWQKRQTTKRRKQLEDEVLYQESARRQALEEQRAAIRALDTNSMIGNRAGRDVSFDRSEVAADTPWRKDPDVMGIRQRKQPKITDIDPAPSKENLPKTVVPAAVPSNVTVTAQGRRVYQGRTAARVARLKAGHAARMAARAANGGVAESKSLADADVEPTPTPTPTHTIAPGRSVNELLDTLRLSEYKAAFAAEAVSDVQVLLDMAADGTLHESLKELGVHKLGHRHAIAHALKQYQQ